MQWDIIVVAAIGAVPLTITAIGTWKTARSVGHKNGKGSIQEQLESLANSKQHSDEAIWNINSNVHEIKRTLGSHEEWQKNHSALDLETFGKLDETIEHLKSLIGEPEEGYNPTQ